MAVSAQAASPGVPPLDTSASASSSSSSSSSSPPSSAPPSAKASPAVPPWASLASGAASGAASCLLLQPMDLLKTRMQQQQQLAQGSMERRGGPARRTARLVGVAKQVVHDDGWRGLWRGTVPTVARNVPGVALYFYSVSEMRGLLSRSEMPLMSLRTEASTSSVSSASKQGTLARLTVLGNLASGAVARIGVGFILSPVTIVKARFESSHFSKDAYPTLARAIAEVYNTGGVRGLFRGFSATALRDAPYAGLYLAIYEKTKDGLANAYRRDERGSSAIVSASGVIAGTSATLLTHPFDILKTRMQTMPDHALASVVAATAKPPSDGTLSTTGKPSGPSLLNMTRYILQREGAGAFLDGLGLRCARKAASSAIGWTIFEGGRGLWVRSYEDRQKREQQRDVLADTR